MKENIEFRQIDDQSDENSEKSLIDKILESRGVSDIVKYKSLKENLGSIPEMDPFDFFNMGRAVNALTEAFKADKKIGILVDGDADGFSSASIMKMYLNKVYNRDKINILSLPFKSHGLGQAMDMIKEADIDFLIIPDAGSNDFDKQEELHELGIESIILDHHDIDEQDKAITSPTIIVNNMLMMNKSTNVNFVGSGMTYEFIKALDTVFEKGTDDALPLFAIGQIGDMSDISDFEIRQNVLRGYEEMKNHPLFHAVFTDFEIDNMSSHKLAFELIPKINAVSRVGTIEERISLVKSFSKDYDEDETLKVPRRRKNKKTGKMDKVDLDWTNYELEIDLLKKIKSRQDSVVKKSVAALEYISEPKDGVMIGVMQEDQPMSLSGLIANKIISKYSMPAFVVKKVDGKYSGSMRCPGEFEFRTWLNDTGLAKSQGHEQAAGVEFKSDDLDSILNKTKELDIAKDFYEVDYIYDKDTTNVNDVKDINENIEYFGGRVFEPRLGFKNIPISKGSIKVRGSVVTIIYKNLTFLMYNGTSFQNWLVNTGFQQDFNFDFYGTPAINDWGNVITHQIILNDISIDTENEANGDPDDNDAEFENKLRELTEDEMYDF